jgi:hypothetical protein
LAKTSQNGTLNSENPHPTQGLLQRLSSQSLVV